MSEDNHEEEYPSVDDYSHLFGRLFTFENGDSIEIIQIKRRDTGPWVTYHVQQGPGIPRKMVIQIEQFLDLYGHLFE